MSRITRYVIWELLRTFLVTLLVMTVFMVMIFLVQEAWRENLTPETILKLVPFTLPTALCFAIPGTILFSTCIIYGRMSASNEITAIKSMGVSPMVVIWPGIVVAVLLSLCTVYLNDLSVSWGKNGIYRVVLNSSAKTIYAVLRSQGQFQKGKMSIIVEGVQGDQLINPNIERASENPAERIRIRAQMARIRVSPETNQLIFQLKNAHLEYGDLTVSIDEEEFPIALGDTTKKTDTGTSPSNLPLRRMGSEAKLQRKLISERKREMALNASFQLFGGNMVALAHPNWMAELERLDHEIRRHHRLKTEPWRRWANGFSCLCFVMVGAAVAIRFQRFDFWSIFAVCFIPILLAYYPLLMMGVGRAKSGELPPYCVWIGNVVLLTVGLWLIRKIEKN